MVKVGSFALAVVVAFVVGVVAGGNINDAKRSHDALVRVADDDQFPHPADVAAEGKAARLALQAENMELHRRLAAKR